MFTEDHPNVENLKLLYQFVDKKFEDKEDSQGLNRLVSEPFIAHIPFRSPFGGDFVGIYAYLDHLRLWKKLSAERPIYDTIKIVANDSCAISTYNINSKFEKMGSRSSFEGEIVCVWHFLDGKLSEMWETVSNTPCFDSFLFNTSTLFDGDFIPF